MDDIARAHYELRLRYQLVTRRGNSFQDFFADLMELRRPGDFQRVRAAGRRGDLKNDGRIPSEETIFQCHAPTDLAGADRKMQDDFDGAMEAWPDLRRWIFVHNDPTGTPATILQKADELSRNERGVLVEVWSIAEISREMAALTDADLLTLLGPALTREDILRVGYLDLEPVLDRVAAAAPPVPGEVRRVSEEKLDANGLSEGCRMLIRAGMEGAMRVRSMVDEWPDPQFGDRVASGFSLEYRRLKESGLGPDDIYLMLQQWAGGADQTPPRQAAVLSVLAYLFESCDIFEDPGP